MVEPSRCQCRHPQDDLEAAQSWYEAGRDMVLELGDQRALAKSHWGLGRVALRRGDLAAARTLQDAGLPIRAAVAERDGLAESLEGLASVLLAQSEATKAVRLWSGAHALRESIRALRYPIEQAEYDRDLAQARTELGEKAFSAAWERGRELTWEQATADARNG